MGLVKMPSSKGGEKRLLELYNGDPQSMERDIAGILAEPRLMNKWADNVLRRDVHLVVSDGEQIHDYSGPGPWANTPKWGEGPEKALMGDTRVMRTLAVNYLICFMEGKA